MPVIGLLVLILVLWIVLSAMAIWLWRIIDRAFFGDIWQDIKASHDAREGSGQID